MAVKTAEVLVQSKLFALVAVAAGTLASCVTVTLDTAKQPFVGFVTVTVKVPGAFVVAVAAVPKLFDQLYVTPVAGVAVKTVEVLVQSKLFALVAVAAGTLASWVTVTVDTAKQPFVGFVTVTVKVPAVVTVAVAFVPKLFDQL